MLLDLAKLLGGSVKLAEVALGEIERQEDTAPTEATPKPGVERGFLLHRFELDGRWPPSVHTIRASEPTCDIHGVCHKGWTVKEAVG